MTSDRKIRANRANARASTGPRSVHGRARAARNALRHGLTLPVCSDPGLSEEVEVLARQIAGTDAKRQIQQLARCIAEAQVDLRRVRYARHQVLSEALSEQHSHAKVGMKNLTSMPAELQNFALMLSEKTKQLLALERYERRALLRRNTVIREFDKLRLQTTRL